MVLGAITGQTGAAPTTEHPATHRSATPASQGLQVPYSAGRKFPAIEIPANACDAHHHIYDPVRFAYVPEDVRQIIIKEVERRDGWGYELYENCDHAFARPNGAHFVADAAAKAEQLSIAFMQKHLAS